MKNEKKENLIAGICRKSHRYQEDTYNFSHREYELMRPRILQRDKYTCQYCGLMVKSIDGAPDFQEMHHVDGDHFNNSEDNLITICKFCHPYHHVGEVSRVATIRGIEEGKLPLKDVAIIELNPDESISAVGLNQLMQAIAIASTNPLEREMAKKILSFIVNSDILLDTSESFIGKSLREQQQQGKLGEYKLPRRINPKEFRMGLSQLNDNEYDDRGEALAHTRLVYSWSLLSKWGESLTQYLTEQTSMVSAWEGFSEKSMAILKDDMRKKKEAIELANQKMMEEDHDVNDYEELEDD